MNTIEILLDQLWKLDDNSLKNKEDFWRSNDHWEFEIEGADESRIRIINRSKSKFLSVCNNEGNVSETDFNQFWIKENLDNEGYFTLRDVSTKKILTAVSDGSLKVEGIY